MFVEGGKTEVKADPFKLETLISWLEKQNPAAKYDFWCLNCCLGSYFQAHGFDLLMIGTGTFTTRAKRSYNLPKGWNRIAQTEPHNYGAALSRARAIR